MKKAIITGVLGQDGSYLAEHLLDLDYEVIGVYRRISSGTNFNNLASISGHEHLRLIPGDILDYGFMTNLIGSEQPDEFYNLAAMSQVAHSFKTPVETFRLDAESVIGQLEIIKNVSPNTRFYQASTSELFGGLNCPVAGYTEDSPMKPRSPYAVAKLAAHETVRNYRESYGMFTCAGILFNHGSPRRPNDFATRKITDGVAKVKLGILPYLEMGNMEAIRDEGHARDYVKAMHLMLQQETPDDFVIATGENASIGEMLDHVCKIAGLDYNDVYRMNPAYMRPSEVPYLLGDCTKARNALGWSPQYNWKSLLEEMYEADFKRLSNGGS